MENLIKITLDATLVYFEEGGMEDNLYRIIQQGNKVGLLLGNIDIVFPLYEFKEGEILFNDVEMLGPLRELLDRMFDLKKLGLEDESLFELIDTLELNNWTMFVEDMLYLPELLEEVFENINITVLN